MVCILLGTGFEEMEVICPCDILRRGGVDVKLVGLETLDVVGAHGISLRADMLINELSIMDVEMVIIPGGLGGVEQIEDSGMAMELIHMVFECGGEIAAICAGPRVLGKLGILRGRTATCFPGMENEVDCDKFTDETVVRCGTVTTSRAPGTAMQFGFALLEIVKGQEIAEMIADAMCFHG